MFSLKISIIKWKESKLKHKKWSKKLIKRKIKQETLSLVMMTKKYIDRHTFQKSQQ